MFESLQTTYATFLEHLSFHHLLSSTIIIAKPLIRVSILIQYRRRPIQCSGNR